jgi:hypothetical protein
MKIWIIWVRPSLGSRYIDSIWADDGHASERLTSLRTSMSACGNEGGCYRHDIYKQEAVMADASLTGVQP